MPKRTQPHEEILAQYLQDPREVAAYLNAALEDSEESFLEALGDVAVTVKMSALAGRAGVARQAAYRMLSKTGNPTYRSLSSILRALDLEIAVRAAGVERPSDDDTATITSDTGTEAEQIPTASINDNVVSIEIGRYPRKLHIATPPMAEAYDLVGSQAGTGL